MRSFFKAVAVTAALAVAASPAHAADCSAADISISNSFFVGCFVFPGNTNNSGIIDILNGDAPYNGGATWTYSSSNNSNEAGNGIFGEDLVTQTGTFHFDGSGVNGWFAIGLKQSNFTGVYVYNTGNTLITEFDYNSQAVGTGNALSHAGFYRGDFTDITTNTVPEPSTYALMASGLLAMGFAARRRRRS